MLQFFCSTAHSTASAQALIQAHKYHVEHPTHKSLLISVVSDPTILKASEVITADDNYSRLIFRPYDVSQDVNDGSTDTVHSIITEIKPFLNVRRTKTLPPHVHITVIGAHLLTNSQVDELRYIADLDTDPRSNDNKDPHSYTVLCYGLRTQPNTQLFPGSLRLFEVADTITLVPTTCSCGRPATFNHFSTLSKDSLKDPNEPLNWDPLCSSCYYNSLTDAELAELESISRARNSNYHKLASLF